MKNLLLRSFLLSALIAAVLSGTASAQTRSEDFLISAKAGRINLLTGSATYRHQGEQTWQPLTNRIVLDTGDTIKVGNTGRLEMLLNPGSYLRLNAGSELELANADIDYLQLRLVSGSAILEMTGIDQTQVVAEVFTPQGRFAILRKGLYRVNVLPSNQTEVLVQDGQIGLGDKLDRKVKSGKRVLLPMTDGEFAKLEKNETPDEFSLWSKDRASLLAEANNRLSQTAVAGALSAFQANGARGFGYAPFFGLWMYDPFLTSYVFFPFYGGWRSPYGYNYWGNAGIPWAWMPPVRPTMPVAPGASRPMTGEAVGKASFRNSIVQKESQNFPIRVIGSKNDIGGPRIVMTAPRDYGFSNPAYDGGLPKGGFGGYSGGGYIDRPSAGYSGGGVISSPKVSGASGGGAPMGGATIGKQ